jgi:hypothetical protein
MPQQGQLTIGISATLPVSRKDAAFAGSKRRKTMVETIKYPAPMTKGAKKEAFPKRETEKKKQERELSSSPKRDRVRVRMKKYKDPSALSEQWHRYFYIYPHQAARARMQQNIKEGIAFAKEAVAYRMPLPVLRINKLGNDDEFPVCPRCDALLEREYMAYCSRCGQCLDWSMIEQARYKPPRRK